MMETYFTFKVCITLKGAALYVEMRGTYSGVDYAANEYAKVIGGRFDHAEVIGE